MPRVGPYAACHPTKAEGTACGQLVGNVVREPSNSVIREDREERVPLKALLQGPGHICAEFLQPRRKPRLCPEVLGKINIPGRKSKLDLLSQDQPLETEDTRGQGHHLANLQRVPFASRSQQMVPLELSDSQPARLYRAVRLKHIPTKVGS